MKTIKFKNNTGDSDSWVGQTIEDGEYYQPGELELPRWKENLKVQQDVSFSKLVVNSGADVVDDILDPVLGWDWVKDVPPTNDENVPLVDVTVRRGKPGSSSLTLVTHDMGARQTWYQKSNRVTDEILTDSGDGLTFNSVSTWWVNIDHPCLSFDYKLIPTRTGIFGQREDWAAIVKVDDVVQTGGYTINWEAGEVVFDSSQAGKEVKVDYSENGSVSNPSEWLLVPPPGKAFELEHSELQFSQTIDVTDTVHMEVWAGGANLAAYGDFNQTLYDLGYGQGRFTYRGPADYINRGNEGKGVIPAFSGHDVKVRPVGSVIIK